MTITRPVDVPALPTVPAEDDVVDLLSRLIRFDTSNFGGGQARGERDAADWVAEVLRRAGHDPVVLESAPGRGNVVVRIPGADRAAPGLLVHAHLDVVPAEASDWSVDPFGGDVRDGAVWGRGALDMKDTAAVLLAVVRDWARTGRRPATDVVLAFVADEEDTGRYGAGFLVDEHADLFTGIGDAIGESGGGSSLLPDGGTLFTVATAERGTAWLRLRAHGEAGHGSRPYIDNAVRTLVQGLARLSAHEWPVHLTPTVSTLLDGLSDRLGVTVDPDDPRSLRALGAMADLLQTTVRPTLNPTMLRAGYKVNVIPSDAVAHVDMRLLPGTEDVCLAEVDRLLGPGITREFVSRQSPIESPASGPRWDAMRDALLVEEPAALVLPFCMGGGTDAKWFARLGLNCYGFTPARYPHDFAVSSYVHGVDEHVPVDALHFGVRVLDRFLTTPPDFSTLEDAS